MNSKRVATVLDTHPYGLCTSMCPPHCTAQMSYACIEARSNRVQELMNEGMSWGEALVQMNKRPVSVLETHPNGMCTVMCPPHCTAQMAYACIEARSNWMNK